MMYWRNIASVVVTLWPTLSPMLVPSDFSSAGLVGNGDYDSKGLACIDP